MTADERYMQRCIDIALNGLGNVAPNPMVGAVIVHDDKIIGEGFHQQFGKPHAEVNAISNAIEKYDSAILLHSTLYVNLEPCTHHGKTPPCTDLIISKNIPNVVIGNMDPFEKVNGSGIRKLTAAGIKVTTAILEASCMELNKRFFTFHKKHRPYIILKYAQSMDGFIAPAEMTEENKWISNEYSRKLVHKWRSEEQAIMIGTNTAEIDNPQLTVREWKGNNPVRLVIDRNLKLKASLMIFNQSSTTYIYNSVKSESKNNLEFIQIDFDKAVLRQISDSLYQKNIQSVIIEGGAALLQSFIDENLWDEARIFTGNNFLGDGIKAPVIKGKIIAEENILNDKLTILKY